MNESKTIEFQGQQYFDDRVFILYLCKGEIKIEEGIDGAVWTTIYHDEVQAPENHVWCVVTYRNCGRYPLFRIDTFYKKIDAENYIRETEPHTPLVSLGGNPPERPLSYEDFLKWKKENNLTDYNWKILYSSDGANQQEKVGQTKDQFRGIK